MTDLERTLMVYGGIVYSKQLCENKSFVGVKGLQPTINTLANQLAQIHNLLEQKESDEILAACQRDVYSLL